MREIIFRGKARYGGYLVEGVYINDCYILPKTDLDRISVGGMILNEVVEVVPSTVGQYTGLKDKHGNMIFEGDIVHIDNYDEGWDSTVEFKGGAFAVDVEGREYDYTAIGWTEYEAVVIGNIHDKEQSDGQEH
jgi:uncharacterized phage protein (TIGR01671 family)